MHPSRRSGLSVPETATLPLIRPYDSEVVFDTPPASPLGLAGGERHQVSAGSDLDH